MSEIEFRYQLDGVGWAKCQIRVNQDTAEARASYLSDALPNFLIMLAQVALAWTDKASCRWDEEPGEFRWYVTRRPEGRAHLRLFWDGDDPDSTGRRLDVTCQMSDLVRAVLDGVEAMKIEVGGSKEYEKQWAMQDYDPDAGFFPQAIIDDLRAYLERGWS